MGLRDEALKAMNEGTAGFFEMTSGRFAAPNGAALDGLLDWLEGEQDKVGEVATDELIDLLREGER